MSAVAASRAISACATNGRASKVQGVLHPDLPGRGCTNVGRQRRLITALPVLISRVDFGREVVSDRPGDWPKCIKNSLSMRKPSTGSSGSSLHENALIA
ncbi:hypothetical protein OKW35_004226 [Paraburkholderia sp. MM5477-R1]